MAKRPTEADIKKVMAELGRRGAAALNGALTPEQRRQSAKKAAAARWGTNGTAAALAPDTESAEGMPSIKKRKD